MKVGSIHKNSKTRYFAVGGYFCFEEDKIKIKSKSKESKEIRFRCWNKVIWYDRRRENLIKELKPKNFRVSLFPRNSSNKK